MTLVRSQNRHQQIENLRSDISILIDHLSQQIKCEQNVIECPPRPKLSAINKSQYCFHCMLDVHQCRAVSVLDWPIVHYSLVAKASEIDIYILFLMIFSLTVFLLSSISRNLRPRGLYL